jgi:isopentenyl diphosphate isomerase/L-lactate dehydrogenase-like FMN-dependent dehydrogenase
MRTHQYNDASRRRFLRFLAGSPLLGYAGMAVTSPAGSEIVEPSEAINVFDLEDIARKNLPPAHFGYLTTGVDDEVTLRANREGFLKFRIRSRRLVDTRQIDMRTRLFGTEWPTPIILAPAGSQRAFHEDGELATAKAAKSRNHLQILSTVSTVSVEDVIAAREAPVWFQLYPTAKWSVTQGLVRRAQAAGCPVVALTLDQATAGSRETLARARKEDSRVCTDCHAKTPGSGFFRKPMFQDLDISGLNGSHAHLTWEFVDRLKDLTSMKVVLKGIVTEEDARLAVEHGVDGVIVSNHGGRGEESGRSTIESLPEVVEAIGGKIPVLIDSGFRRGTDIFKALALGAKGVCIGRPYLWGLAAFGKPGVERALELLTNELEMAMRMNGTPTISSITRRFVTGDTRNGDTL